MQPQFQIHSGVKRGSRLDNGRARFDALCIQIESIVGIGYRFHGKVWHVGVVEHQVAAVIAGAHHYLNTGFLPVNTAIARQTGETAINTLGRIQLAGLSEVQFGRQL